MYHQQNVIQRFQVSDQYPYVQLHCFLQSAQKDNVMRHICVGCMYYVFCVLPCVYSGLCSTFCSDHQGRPLTVLHSVHLIIITSVLVQCLSIVLSILALSVFSELVFSVFNLLASSVLTSSVLNVFLYLFLFFLYSFYFVLFFFYLLMCKGQLTVSCTDFFFFFKRYQQVKEVKGIKENYK